jgi:hypothetical protein
MVRIAATLIARRPLVAAISGHLKAKKSPIHELKRPLSPRAKVVAHGYDVMPANLPSNRCLTRPLHLPEALMIDKGVNREAFCETGRIDS